MDWKRKEVEKEGVQGLHFIKNDWIIIWYPKQKEGYVGKHRNEELVELFSSISKNNGKLPKGLEIPSYVVDKVNEIIKGNSYLTIVDKKCLNLDKR